MPAPFSIFNPGRLRYQITLEVRTARRGPGVAELNQWEPLATVWAEILFGAGRELTAFGTGNEVFAAGAVDAALTHVITIRHRAGLTSECRVVFADPLTGGVARFFNIESIAELGAGRQYQRLYCLELVGQEVTS